ncbi:uncharacterized protein LOC113386617 [Ctenocephalides felis]|uniref:uncharacterized protein LOC113386617 n=1 Tax=Ctenocephalides felis TaxID=7515 RepID=UPI000E6E3DF6|nr:uncharacterized protein LOC113386617 [Ctenocephalides felis]
MKVILHGYAGSLDYNATADIRRAYMRIPNVNVLAVDWGELATLPCYPAAAFNTVQVGHCTANMLLALSILDERFKPEDAHLIGFSLGAHAAAYAANYLKKLTGALQKRITGLDPALPFFSTPQLSWKLDSTDAHYVDIIHTDAGYLGKAEALGHADFYVNGGSKQPICKGEEYEHLCSHNAAPAYFAESIISKVGFYGSKCSSYIEHILRWCPADNKDTREIMGEPSKPGTVGVFYVQTNEKQPFAKVFFAQATPIKSNKFLILRNATEPPNRRDVTIGSCVLVLARTCPDPDVRFYLFTRRNPTVRQYVIFGRTVEESNITKSNFDPKLPTKVIIHGYNSDMYLGPLIDMRAEYLQRDRYNIFALDWSPLAPSPCYPTAVHNTRHAGECLAQMLTTLRKIGAKNVHVIGFSLGAHVPNFAAVAMRPHVIERVTGLDPAMPLFATAEPDDRLDESDALFVDVIHTNALVQGQIISSGHVDFYMNGGVTQPGCWQGPENPFACSHHRAPDYFCESINSRKGFWGWSCPSFLYYLLGLCPPRSNQIQAGEDCAPNSKGFHLVETRSDMPFALGKITELSESNGQDTRDVFNQLQRLTLYPTKPQQSTMNRDDWGKLEGGFNNIQGAIYVPRNLKTTQDEDWDLSHIPVFQTNNLAKRSHNKNSNSKITIENEINDENLRMLMDDFCGLKCDSNKRFDDE